MSSSSPSFRCRLIHALNWMIGFIEECIANLWLIAILGMLWVASCIFLLGVLHWPPAGALLAFPTLAVVMVFAIKLSDKVISLWYRLSQWVANERAKCEDKEGSS